MFNFEQLNLYLGYLIRYNYNLQHLFHVELVSGLLNKTDLQFEWHKLFFCSVLNPFKGTGLTNHAVFLWYAIIIECTSISVLPAHKFISKQGTSPMAKTSPKNQTAYQSTIYIICKKVSSDHKAIPCHCNKPYTVWRTFKNFVTKEEKKLLQWKLKHKQHKYFTF